ncbi:alpha-L-arabinofuranosidase C-terminal domain-containing protein [Bifidobacterium cebidarum]|uniref:non-reducing end alpha-L-arabinofuranosidase n=1 Tax=Bifidobacterium cebidarum TaxID=2650773 RepID=A0A6I1GCE9_9BIFI|nr:alpha-L-arabinofuranosidase C-terminal domain-containing protein [Bifidobacterium cebidarum]KAB7789294.1 alpha-N-arabinofuranosidase [Bifidobacterium cebidarum]
MKTAINARRAIGVRDRMLYGQFLEHFHRQIYGGVFDPGSPLANADGLREDVIEAVRKLNVPIMRWPGGCFVSSYHWQDGVGADREPTFDKTWRVEEPNTFGTDEYIKLCRAFGCEPYICTNAGTGTAEEMSDWVEYCNLAGKGRYARMRADNGHARPFGVKYWSIGNENWGSWEIGAKTREEWGHLVRESAKMIKHVDPTVELSAAALPDIDWNLNLLRSCGDYLDWISIHQYWDVIHETNHASKFNQVMAMTAGLDANIVKVRGLLEALGLQHRIRIAFDEWNLREWYHPKAVTVEQGVTEDEYLTPRDGNDINGLYTMADAVFSASVLNMLHRNCDVVGMACFSPLVNTRGCIFTHPKGIVLRPTYFVFDLYANHLGDTVLDSWNDSNDLIAVEDVQGRSVMVPALDVLATTWADRHAIAIAVASRDKTRSHSLQLDVGDAWIGKTVNVHTLNGSSEESYNDIDHTEVGVVQHDLGEYKPGLSVQVEPHSVNIIEIA